MISEVSVFLTISIILLVGFAGHIFFEKTKIPSFLFLVLMGFIMGPVLHIVDRADFIPLMGVLSTFTLIMVTFYSGLNLNIVDIVSQSGRALLQSLTYILTSVVLIALIGIVFIGWRPIEAFIFSSMTGGEITAAVVVPLAFALGFSNEVKSLLTLESAISTVVTIVLFFMFLNQWLLGSMNIYSAAANIAGNFSVGIIFGLIFSLGFLRVIHHYRDKEYTYVLTMGLVLLLYTIVDWFGGNGELGVLIFGLFLSNDKAVSRIFGTPVDISMIFPRLNQIQSELSFLFETFFFVFLGLVFTTNSIFILRDLAYSLVFLSILLTTRFMAVTLATKDTSMYRDRLEITVMCAQGIVPASLSIYLLRYDLALNNLFMSLITYIIILTNIVTTIGVWRISKKKLRISI
jgi:NhaP-type Na+/H+ or K+/H+ antiporter